MSSMEMPFLDILPDSAPKLLLNRLFTYFDPVTMQIPYPPIENVIIIAKMAQKR